MSKQPILQKVDNFLFVKVDELQDSQAYSEVSEKYSNLEEEKQDIVKTILMILLIVIPITLFMIINNINNGTKDDINSKKELISVAKEFIQKKVQTRSISRKILGSIPIESKAAMQNKISQAIANAQGDSSKYKITDFNTEFLDGDIIEARTDISFKLVDKNGIFNVLNNLILNEKMKLDEINITKNTKQQLFVGNFVLFYYSKQSTQE